MHCPMTFRGKAEGVFLFVVAALAIGAFTVARLTTLWPDLLWPLAAIAVGLALASIALIVVYGRGRTTQR